VRNERATVITLGKQPPIAVFTMIDFSLVGADISLSTREAINRTLDSFRARL
jgi:hypothetical protein